MCVVVRFTSSARSTSKFHSFELYVPDPLLTSTFHCCRSTTTIEITGVQGGVSTLVRCHQKLTSHHDDNVNRGMCLRRTFVGVLLPKEDVSPRRQCEKRIVSSTYIPSWGCTLYGCIHNIRRRLRQSRRVSAQITPRTMIPFLWDTRQHATEGGLRESGRHCPA